MKNKNSKYITIFLLCFIVISIIDYLVYGYWQFYAPIISASIGTISAVGINKD